MARDVECDEAVVVKVVAKNNTDKPVKISTAVRASVIRYTGVKIDFLGAQKKNDQEIAAKGG